MSTGTTGRRLVGRTVPALTVAVLGLASASTARAQATVTGDNLHAEADSYFYDSGFFYFGNGWNHSDSPIQGHDWNDTRTSSYSNTGFSGTAFGRNTSAYTPSNPGVGGIFKSLTTDLDAHSAITESDLTGTHAIEDSYAKVWSNVLFTLTQPTHWTWEADVAGSCSANGWDNQAGYWFIINNSANTVNFADSRLRSYNGGADYNSHISLSGDLPAGDYSVSIRVEAFCTQGFGVGGVGNSSSTLTGEFNIPAPGATALLGVALLAAGRRRRA